jgi:HAD superfamily hydrolase (TIGR01509 family)
MDRLLLGSPESAAPSLRRSAYMTNPLHPPGEALQAILLDIDGTLIDSNDAHARAWVGSLAEHGYVVLFEQVRGMIGMGGDKILPQLVGLDPESGEAKRIARSRSELFRRELPSLRPTRGARDMLVLLRDQGFDLVVATSAQKHEVKALLEQAGVADLIDDAASSGDADASKPEPDIVQAALAKAERLAAHSVLIGDTPYDIEAAARANVNSVALRCGGHWDDAALGGAIAIYDDPADLAANFGSSPLNVRG